MNSYNGFTGRERDANDTALGKAIEAGTVPAPAGPCSICGDPHSKVEYHSEDYSKPYSWVPPAAYIVCVVCHRNKLHKRFANPIDWEAFKAHVRRGGYASELKQPDVVEELKSYKEELKRNKEDRKSEPKLELRSIRLYPHVVGTEWWANLPG